MDRAVYLGEGGDWSFGLIDRGREASGAGVLICGPWGWEEVASYRGRREWARDLAEDGHTVLRLELPSVGDAGGVPRDRELVAAWTGAISAGTTWLREDGGCTRTVVIGLGLGGLLAARALSAGPVFDELVLWSTPAKGQSFVRAQRAFARLQSSGYTLGGDQESGLPEGWMEAGGFVLSRETIAAIQAIDFGELDLTQLRRALVLDHDGVQADAAVIGALSDAGVEVAEADGPGWDALTGHPESYRPALEVYDQVGEWIGFGTGAGAASPEADQRTDIAFDWDGHTVTESVVERQPLFGILTQPAPAVETDLCALFLNAGAIRRVGPSRLWTEAARRFAARGVPSLRVDFAAIGEADGDATAYSQASEFYTPELAEQVSDALDLLEARGLGPRFLLTGLCSGSYWAFHAAVADPRVAGACLLNPRALFWDADVDAGREARRLRRLLQPVWWRRLLSGYVSFARMREILSGTARSAARPIRRLVTRSPRPLPDSDIEHALQAIADNGTRLVLAFSGDEPLEEELRRDGLLGSVGSRGRMRVVNLPARDHALRPLIAQRAAHELLDAELEALREGVPARPSPKA